MKTLCILLGTLVAGHATYAAELPKAPAKPGCYELMRSSLKVNSNMSAVRAESLEGIIRVLTLLQGDVTTEPELVEESLGKLRAKIQDMVVTERQSARVYGSMYENCKVNTP